MPCPSCQSSRSRPLGHLTDRLFRTTDKQFELHECAECAVVFLSPTPTGKELSGYYPSGYWWQTAASAGDSLWHKLLETYRRIMIGSHVRRIKRLTPRGSGARARILDLGCGDGLLLAACRPLPVARVGFDLSFEALRAARARGGMSVSQGSLDAQPFAGESFSVVSLFHVLEHVSFPGLCLQEAHRLLEPGGWLVVEVPNHASLQRQLLGSRWAGFDVPRHLANFSTRSLSALVEQSGFNVRRVSQFCLRDNPGMIVTSLFPGLYPPWRRLHGRSRTLGRALADSVMDIAFLFLVVAATPLALLESVLGRGGAIVVEAQKPAAPAPSREAPGASLPRESLPYVARKRPRLRVGIDAITPGGEIFMTRGGVRTYLVNLLQTLVEREPDHDYVLFTSRRGLDLMEPPTGKLRVRVCPGVPVARSGRALYEQTLYPLLIAQEKLDVFLATHNILPLLLGIPTVVVIQSLQYFDFPDPVSPLRRAYLRRLVPLSLRKAARVITPSEYAKADAVRHTGVSAEKVQVIPHGLPDLWARNRQAPSPPVLLDFVRRFSQGSPYLLTASNFYEFKNFRRLFEAFALLRSRHQISHRLVVAGSEADFSYAHLKEMAAAQGVQEVMACTGRLDPDQLSALYRHADLLVYPSLCEAFGFVPLEAMASGCPVVVARSSALPEVVGEAAEWVDPTSAADIARGVYRVLSDIERRTELVARGFERVEQFTWERSAQETLAVIEQAARRA